MARSAAVRKGLAIMFGERAPQRYTAGRSTADSGSARPQTYHRPPENTAHSPSPNTRTGTDDDGQDRYAPLGRRAVARLIDMTGFFILSAPVLAIFGPPLGDGTMPGTFTVTPASVISAAIIIALWGGYEVILTVIWGQTLGKAAAGISVVRASDGRTPRAGASLARWLFVLVAYIMTPVALTVLWLSPLTDSSKRMRGWHDRAVGTVVVQPPGRIERSVWADDFDEY
jgi:uncharacterized RDD family membrane protein YckC